MHTHHRRLLFSLLALVLTLSLMMAACGGRAPAQTSVPTGAVMAEPTPMPDQDEPAQGQEPAAVQGSAALPDPMVGLQAVPNYQAVYRQAFQGTDLDWSETYSLSVASDTSLRALAYATTGEDKTRLYPAFTARLGEVIYWKEDPEGACMTGFAETGADPREGMPEPAGLLPPVQAMEPGGAPEEVNGVLTQAYQVTPASFGERAGGRLEGRVWLAVEGGYVVKYTLSIKTDEATYPDSPAGVYTWEYHLDAARSELALPADCPAPLPDLPLMEGAQEVERFPNVLAYRAPVEPAAVTEFYSTTLQAFGYSPAGEALGNPEAASMRFTQGGQVVTVSVTGGEESEVLIVGRPASLAGPAAPQPTAAAPVTPEPAVDLPARIGNALTVLIGSDATPSVFPSYHIEVTDQAPAWNDSGNQAGQAVESISADVAGTSLFFSERLTAADGGVKENLAYLIDEEEFVVKEGGVEPGFGLKTLSWYTWPLGPVIILGGAGQAVQPGGEEPVNGRLAEVYTFTDADTSLLAELMGGFGPQITTASGTVWIDKESGALLKLSADYQAEMEARSGEAKGPGAGHVEIEVSQVGEVTVVLP